LKKPALVSSICTFMLLASNLCSTNAYASSYQPTLKAVYLNGNLINKPYGIVHNGTTYMPIWYTMQALNRLGITNNWDGSTWSLTAPSNLTVDLTNLPKNTTGPKAIFLNNTMVQRVDGIAAVDPSSNQPTTYMPIWYMMQILKRIGVQSSWDGTHWQMTLQNGNKLVVFGWTTNTQSINDAEEHSDILNQIGNDTYTVNSDGTISGSPMPALVSYAQSHQMSVYATVANLDNNGFDEQLMSKILNSTTLSNALLQNLVNLAVQNGYSGINLDFEMMAPADCTPLTSFISNLHTQLHNAGKLLNVTVPAETSLTNEPWNGAYNYSAIGNNSDMVSIMAYDYTWLNNPPGAIAPLWWDDQILSYATSVIPSNKILLGLGTYGYDWNQSGTASASSIGNIDSLLQSKNISPAWDTKDSVPYFTYMDSNGSTHTVYYENQQSLSQKLDLVSKYQLAGVAIWRMGLEDQGLWNALQAVQGP